MTAEKRDTPAGMPSGGGGMVRGGPGGFGHRGGGAGWMTGGAKPKNLRMTLARLWQYFKTERKLFTVVFLFVFLSTGIGLSGPYLIGRAMDAMAAGGRMVDFGLLKMTVMVLLAAYLTDAAITMAQGWLMAGISQRIVQTLRQTLFTKLHRLPIAYFDLHSHGELMSRLTNDIDNVSSTISQSTAQLMNNVLMITGSLVLMLILSPLLTLASLVTIPLVSLLTKAITGKTRLLFRQQQAILGELNGYVEENISGIGVVKAFNHETQVVSQFRSVNEPLCSIGIKAQIWSGYLMPLMNVINNIGFTAVAGVGGILAVRNMITIGVIASFLSYSRQFSRPLNDIANIYNTLQTALAGAERVFEVLDETEEPQDSICAVELAKPKGEVVFDRVTFGYRADLPILKAVSFAVEPGSSIALVGPTGAGKTTIVNLLARFYDVTEGSIRIDGRDIREYSRNSLRNCFGIVLQDTNLFGGTIADNIRYGRLDASRQEIEMAARMANADLFIKRLPQGYETPLNENGGNLSQGQRQLIAIARTILADPAILILDEATSNVDTRTELHIQEAMLNLMRGRTSFIIAHRLSTIRDADIIMVIEGGRIVERGNHDQLLKQQGVYHHLYFSQFNNGETC